MTITEPLRSGLGGRLRLGRGGPPPDGPSVHSLTHSLTYFLPCRATSADADTCLRGSCAEHKLQQPLWTTAC